MAYICYKPAGTKCTECEHYRYDEENGRMACFAQIDEKKGCSKENNLKK